MPPQRTLMKTTRWILLFIAVAYLLTGIYQIRPEERAVVKRFGRIAARPGPGLWIGLPWGIDRVERVPIAQIQRVSVGYQLEGEENTLGVPPGLMLTGDDNLVNLRVSVDFAVAEGDAALDDYVLNRSQAEAVIAREAESLLTEWASGRPIADILQTSSGDLPSWLTPRLQARLEPHRLGIRIQYASVALATAPSEVKQDFERVNQAESVNKSREHRARQEETQRVREALNTKYRLEQEATSYAEAREAIAREEAKAFVQRLEQYHRLRQQHPDILNAIWWEEMSRVFVNLKERGRIDLLDHYLGPDGLTIMQGVPLGRKR